MRTHKLLAALAAVVFLAVAPPAAAIPNTYVTSVSADDAGDTVTFGFNAAIVYVYGDDANEIYVRWNTAAVADGSTSILIPARHGRRFMFASGKGPASVSIICSAAETATVRVEAFDRDGQLDEVRLSDSMQDFALNFDTSLTGALTATSLTTTDDVTVGDDLVVTDDAAITGLATVGETLGVTGVATFVTTIRQLTANGASMAAFVSSEAITLSTSGATTDSSANLLPADSIIDAVVCRVTTTITTATDWGISDPTTTLRFSAVNSTMTAGATIVGLKHMFGNVTTTAAGPTQAAAAKLRITTTGTPGAGAVRCTVFGRTFIAPTS